MVLIGMDQKLQTPESSALRDLRLEAGRGEAFQQGAPVLWHYVWVLRRYAWVLVLFPLLGLAWRYYSTIGEPPVYMATAQMLIDDDSGVIRGFDPTSKFAASQKDIETQLRILRSHTLALAVIEKLDLVNSEEFALPASQPKPGLFRLVKNWVRSVVPTTKAPLDGERDKPDVSRPKAVSPHQLVAGFTKRIAASPVAKTRLIRVSFSGRDPKIITKIVNTLVKTHMEMESKRELFKFETMLEYLRVQQQEFQKKVEASEEELLAYKREKNLVALENREEIQTNKLAALTGALSNARLAAIRAEGVHETLKAAVEKGESLEALSALDPDGEVLNLSREHTRLEEETARLSKTFGPKHRRMIELRENIAMTKALLETEVKLALISSQSLYDVAKAEEARLKEVLDQQKREALDLEEKIIRFNVIKREAGSNQQLFDLLLMKAKEMSLAGQFTRKNIHVMSQASVPTTPIPTGQRRRLISGALFGLAVAVGLAFFFDYLDHSIKSGEDVESYIGLQLLGGVGQFVGKSSGGPRSESVIVSSSPKSSLAESFRSIRTNLLFTLRDVDSRSFVVTSSEPKEGKSTIAANLAVVIGQSGKRVLLVDADMRRPVAHKIFGIGNEVGLSSYLVGKAKKEDIIAAVSLDGLSAAPCGPLPSNQSELLGSEAMVEFADWASKEFDIVIYDSPPLASVSDALVLSGITKGSVFVIRAGSTGRGIARRCVEQMRDHDVRVIGAILNNIDTKRGGYSNYFYGYPYYYKNYYRYSDYYSSGEDDAGSEKTRRRRG